MLRSLASICLLLTFTATGAFGEEMMPPPFHPDPDVVPHQLTGIGIDQKLNGQIPLDVPFTDETGKTVHLGDYLNGKPAILVLAYYECPRLCTFVLNGIGDAIHKLNLKFGADYQIITVSINPKEGPKLASLKKASYIEKYAPGKSNGWHFLTGPQASITKLANAVGYRYKYDPKTDQFYHATDIMVVTPKGKLSHYFMGISYSARDLRLALVQASDGKIGTPVDKFLLYCCSIDLTTGKYTASIWKIMQVVGCGFALTLFALIFILWKYEPKNTVA